jgi:hypothetical protein
MFVICSRMRWILFGQTRLFFVPTFCTLKCGFTPPLAILFSAFTYLSSLALCRRHHCQVSLKVASLLADACRCCAVLKGEPSNSPRAEVRSKGSEGRGYDGDGNADDGDYQDSFS